MPDARLAQPLEVAGRVGEPVGMVDAQPVDEAVAHEADRQAVRLLEHLGILLAHAGEVVDVEEAAVAAGLPGGGGEHWGQPPGAPRAGGARPRPWGWGEVW